MTAEERKEITREVLRSDTVLAHLGNITVELGKLKRPEFSEACCLARLLRSKTEAARERLLEILHPDLAPEITEGESSYRGGNLNQES